MAFIRPYLGSDFDNMSHICRATLPPSLAASEPATRLAPYIWTHPYTTLSPTTCLVLDDGTGLAVGYCVGCRDADALCAAYPRYVREVLEARDEVHVQRESDGEQEGERRFADMVFSARRAILCDGYEDLRREGYRATMHVDILDGFRGCGWGRRLVEGVVARMKVDGGGAGEGEGVGLGVGAENVQVVPFYEKLGFQAWKGRAKTTTTTTKTTIMVRDFLSE